MKDMIDLRGFAAGRADEPLVLCTIVGKKDYGYRAVGARKIVGADDACGILSGGCLEGEIERAARDGIASLPFVKSFSTSDAGDRLFGYQAGCPGVIDILFECIDAAVDPDLYFPFGPVEKAKGVSVDVRTAQRVFADGAEEGKFFDPWRMPVTLCIIGCGPDAPVFADFAGPMGWDARFIDYRAQGHVGGAEIVPVEEIVARVPDGVKTAVVLMTHNYEADMEILAGLQGRVLGYCGCLGPRIRYDQMKADLLKMRGTEIDSEWEKIVHAPAGLFTGGRAPEEIALSVIAQIQSLLRDKDDG